MAFGRKYLTLQRGTFRLDTRISRISKRVLDTEKELLFLFKEKTISNNSFRTLILILAILIIFNLLTYSNTLESWFYTQESLIGGLDKERTIEKIVLTTLHSNNGHVQIICRKLKQRQ